MGSGLSISSVAQKTCRQEPEPLTTVHYRKIFESLTTGVLSDSTHQRRPPLPTELALYILRLAGCTTARSVHSNHAFSAISHGPLLRKLWFTSPPLTKRMLVKLASVRLVTMSMHQGWVSNPNEGSWSWWELGVLRGDSTLFDGMEGEMEGTPKECEDVADTMSDSGSSDSDSRNGGSDSASDDTSPLRSFISHRHDVHMRSNDGQQVHNGVRFDRGHELWHGYDHISNEESENRMDTVADDGGPMREGDRIGVFGCAQYPGWACYGGWARLELEVFWEPEEVKGTDVFLSVERLSSVADEVHG